MNTYLFYTDEGYTVAPSNKKLDSLQILGIEEGNTELEGWQIKNASLLFL